MQIQWIEMVYNNTDVGLVKTGKCVNICSIDETTKLGQPVLITGGMGRSFPLPSLDVLVLYFLSIGLFVLWG